MLYSLFTTEEQQLISSDLDKFSDRNRNAGQMALLEKIFVDWKKKQQYSEADAEFRENNSQNLHHPCAVLYSPNDNLHLHLNPYFSPFEVIRFGIREANSG